MPKAVTISINSVHIQTNILDNIKKVMLSRVESSEAIWDNRVVRG